MKAKIDAFYALAKKYGFKVRNGAEGLKLCAQDLDHKWVPWVGFNPNADRTFWFGNTDQLNIWLSDTRKDFGPEKCLLFVGELNKVLGLMGDNRFRVRELIDPEDWQGMARVDNAYADKRFLGVDEEG